MAAKDEEIEFRILEVKICDWLSKDELRKIVFVHLFSKRHRFLSNEVDGLEIFTALEHAGVFSPTAPEGLLKVVEVTENKQVANVVKDFVKKFRKRTSGKCGKSAAAQSRDAPTPDAHLQSCYRVAVQQTKLLIQQIEVIGQAVWVGNQDEVGKRKADRAVDNISSTASELVDCLRKARREFGLPRSLSGSSTGSSGSDKDYDDCGEDYEPVEACTPKIKGEKPPVPPTKPRLRECKAYVGMQETAPLQQSSVVVSGRTHDADNSPITGHKKTVHVITPRPQPEGKRPVPVPRKGITKVNKPLEQSPEESEYDLLRLESEGSADSGLGASGSTSGDGEFTDVKKYSKQPFPFTTKLGDATNTRYKALDRNTMNKRLEYVVTKRSGL